MMYKIAQRFARQLGVDERIVDDVCTMYGEEVREELCACAPHPHSLLSSNDQLEDEKVERIDELVMKVTNDVLVGTANHHIENRISEKYGKRPKSKEVQSAKMHVMEAVVRAGLYCRFNGKRNVFISIGNNSMQIDALIPEKYSWKRSQVIYEIYQ